MIRKIPKYLQLQSRTFIILKMNLMDNLRENQKKAINTSYENDFESGVHFHATGTGKSLIDMNIVTQYNQIHPTHNILWICESKSILIDQFSPISQKERNIVDIMRRFNVLNFSNYKTSDWVDSVNAAKFWNKPLCQMFMNFFEYNNHNHVKQNHSEIYIYHSILFSHFQYCA